MSRQLKYIGGRILYAALTVFVLITITFVLMHLLPGDPFSGNKALRPAVQEALDEKYGLGQPILVQYKIYLENIVTGDLGTSFVSGREVTDVISQAFPVSMELGIRALIFALIAGVSLGIIAALKRGTVVDTGVMFLALLGVSIPSFIIGSILQYFGGLVLFQATGIRFFTITGWAGENSKLLPSFALAFSTIAVVSRLMRTSMLEVLEQDYVRTAKAKALSDRAIVLHHCIRNAIMPVITVLGPLAAVLFTGTFVIENIFSIPGLGKYFVESVGANDYPVIVGTTLFFGTFLVTANLIVDILHGLIDPRIRQGRGDNS